MVADIQSKLATLDVPDGVTIKMTGEQEDQGETVAFLGVAAMLAFGLIFMILVTQFNSTSKPIIILAEILFSIIGVLIGFSLFKMVVIVCRFKENIEVHIIQYTPSGLPRFSVSMRLRTLRLNLSVSH